MGLQHNLRQTANSCLVDCFYLFYWFFIYFIYFGRCLHLELTSSLYRVEEKCWGRKEETRVIWEPPTRLLSPDDHPVKKCHIKSMWVPTRALSPGLKVYSEKQVAFTSEILGLPKKKQRHCDSHWQGQRSLTGLTDCEQSRCLRLYWYVDCFSQTCTFWWLVLALWVSEMYTER